jgi:hypothetical protein
MPLSHELFHGLSPDQFDSQAKGLAAAEAMTPQVRARVRAALTERLKTPVDAPSWGPDWVRRIEGRKASGLSLFGAKKKSEPAEDDHPLTQEERDDAQVMVRNLERSRQVSHYRPLYALAVIVALAVAGLAMFVDYHIIREVWTRALSNEFMVVPASLKASVVFKSLQVIFAVLIVHFMLKITGKVGRNAMVTTAFVLAIVMIGGLGYIVAYNNMAGATSATYEHRQQDAANGAGSSIDQLFDSVSSTRTEPARATTAEYALPLPRLSKASLADADSWFWFAFASVIFFIVTVVAALYMETVERNIRNFHIARDYHHRQRQFAQLHMLELADRRQAA